jgi:predicted ATP-grasp superfamily ATP-dependent carboligase
MRNVELAFIALVNILLDTASASMRLISHRGRLLGMTRRSTRHCVVVGATKVLLVQALLAIHASGNARCVIVCQPGAHYLRYSHLCWKYLEMDLSGADDAVFVDSINQLAKDIPDLVVIPVDSTGTRLINRARGRLATAISPAPDSAMLELLDNKWNFYRFCGECGLLAPATRFIVNKHALDFAQTVSALGRPLVIKPVDQDASRGVHIVASEDEYRRTVLDDDTYQYAPLIIQRYVEGADVGVNLLSMDGKVSAVAIQRRIDPTHYGSEIEFFQNDELEAVAHKIAKGAAYHGVMNIDARMEQGTGKIYLFEANPRVWGSMSASVWCGLNFLAKSLEPQSGEVDVLTSGRADTYYHPLFRPSSWRYALMDRGYHGRMMRLAMFDVCTLLTSIRILVFERAWRAWARRNGRNR